MAWEVAVFKRVRRGLSHFVTLPRRLLPPSEAYTITVASAEEWGRGLYVNLVKVAVGGVPRAAVLPKDAVERFRLGGVVWVRVSPFTGRPPRLPRVPYIAKPAVVAESNSTMFFTLSRVHVEMLWRACGVDAGSLLVAVKTARGGRVEYVKQPVPLGGGKYAVVLPSRTFRGRVRAGDVVHVKVAPATGLEEPGYMERVVGLLAQSIN